MISIELLCSGKNAKLTNNEVFTEVTFQVPSTHTGYAAGAAIGVPNPFSLQKSDKMSYNLLSGSLSILINSQEDADKYEIGKTYELYISPKSSDIKPKKNPIK